MSAGEPRGAVLDERKRIAAAIRDYIARERMSREQFAFRTKLGKSTVDKLLVGLFSERTLSIVEAHTPLKLRSILAEAGPRAALSPASAQPPRNHEVGFCRARDGTRLAMACVGAGDVLVKTANWLTHVEFDWASPVCAPLLEALSRDHRLIRYDARGTGLSDREVGESITFETFLGDLEAVVEAAGAGSFSLFGMSQGAAVAIAYAARHPERVRRLVLLNGYAQGRNRRGSEIEMEQARAMLTLMRSGWGDEHSAFMQAFSSIYLPKGTREQIGWFSELQWRTASPENAVRIRRACDEIDVIDLMPLIRAPTLVLHSRYDNVVPFEQGRLIAAAIPGARLVSLESDNHAVLKGEPAWDRMVAEIGQFLRPPDTGRDLG